MLERLLIRVNLPPKLKNLPCQTPNFFSNFSSVLAHWETLSVFCQWELGNPQIIYSKILNGTCKNISINLLIQGTSKAIHFTFSENWYSDQTFVQREAEWILNFLQTPGYLGGGRWYHQHIEDMRILFQWYEGSDLQWGPYLELFLPDRPTHRLLYQTIEERRGPLAEHLYK